MQRAKFGAQFFGDIRVARKKVIVQNIAKGQLGFLQAACNQCLLAADERAIVCK